MIMTGEFITWGVVPAVIGCIAILASLLALVNRRSLGQMLVTIPIVVVVGGSLVILKSIFLDGGWPTYHPHIAIGFATPVAFGQLLLSLCSTHGHGARHRNSL